MNDSLPGYTFEIELIGFTHEITKATSHIQ